MPAWAVAEHGWSVLCSRSIVDRESSQVSLVDLIDVLWIEGPDATEELALAKKEGKEGVRLAVKLVFASWWYRSDYDVPEVAHCRFRLTGPEGQALIEMPYTVNLTEATGGRQFFKIEMLPIPSFGLFRFSTEKLDEAGWQTVSNHPLHLRIRESDPQLGEPKASED